MVIESPFIQVLFMKKHVKNPLFEGLFYDLKGLKPFSKTNFWIFLGVWRAKNLIEYVFSATLLISGIDFFVPPPFETFEVFAFQILIFEWGKLPPAMASEFESWWQTSF